MKKCPHDIDKSKTVMSEELEKAQKRIAEIDKYIQGLFEAKVKGEIDGSLFACLKKNYDDEKNQLNISMKLWFNIQLYKFITIDMYHSLYHTIIIYISIL